VDHLDGILNHRPSTAEACFTAKVIFATRSAGSLFHRPLTVFAW
jgi:hypothetical protein